MDQDTKSRPLERRVFREEIREQLIEDILNGRLAPGARIVETQIAQQFGVSQGPVREALRDLELFGFVVSSPFRGTQVRRDLHRGAPRDLSDQGGARGCRGAAAAVRIDQATLEHLEELIGTMREAAARDDHRGEADADHSFHHAIVKASGNHMLEHVWQTMRLSITTCLTTSITHRSLHEIAERHVAVLEALRSGDPDRAEAAIRRHIEEPGRMDSLGPPAGTGGHFIRAGREEGGHLAIRRSLARVQMGRPFDAGEDRGSNTGAVAQVMCGLRCQYLRGFRLQAEGRGCRLKFASCSQPSD